MLLYNKNLSPLFRVALHVHSHFSMLCGTDSVDSLIGWARRAGYTSLAMTDINNMFGCIPFYIAALAAGIKPIPGVELLHDATSPAGPANATSQRVTLLAQTSAGYRNLCRLTSLLNLQPQRFDLTRDVAANSDGLFVLCDQPTLLASLAEILPPGQLYAALTPGVGPPARSRLRKLYATARELGVPVVVALDSYFAKDQESEIRNPKSEIDAYLLHRIVTDIRRGANRAVRSDDYQPPDRFHRTASQMRQFFARCPEALANAESIAERCRDDIIELGAHHFPAIQTPPGQTSFSFLHTLCARGLRRRYRPIRPEVVTRLAYELSVIDKLHFADYFLFVNEIVSFARRRGIPIDVRGSAAGSLVAYVLGFTQICPIEHDLYFERFLHAGRTDCPDIDIDLCWRRRDEVIDFCYRRWGAEHVAMICTHNTMRARGAFVEVGKVLGLTARQVFALSRHIPEGIAGYLQRDWRELAEARRNLPLDDPHFRRVLELAGRLEGAPRNLGVHCGGLVISPRPLTDYLPLQRAAKGIVVTQYEMNAVEAVGLVKMDLLGNRALSEVAAAGRQLAVNNQQFPDSIDPRDPATAALLRSGDTLGVFQAESPGMRNLCRQLRVGSQEDMTVALSVIRPGPASSGMKASYVARHTGRETPTYLHPKLETLLARTHGVMVYQEDTMRVAVGIAGFSPGEADMLRKAVSKKRSPQRMADLRRQFIDKALTHTPDLSPEVAAELWEQVSHFASYSFCRAHACVYGRIAWQTAWMKAHHPAEFYCAIFNNHMGMYPMRVHVADAIRHGVRVLGPHVNCSDQDSTLALPGEPGGRNPRSAIRLGLRFVRGLSGGAIQRIVAGRPYQTLEQFRRAAELAEPELTNLIRCGTCDGLGASRGEMLAEAALETPVGGLLLNSEFGMRGSQPSACVFADVAGCKDLRPCENASESARVIPHSEFRIPHSELPSRFPWTREFTELEKIQAEIDVLGLFLTRHPMELVSGDWIATGRLAGQVGRRVAVAGVLDATRTTKTSGGELMRFVTLEDQAGLVECTFFPEAYRRFGHLFYHLGPFRVQGVVENDHGAITVTADFAESLVETNPLKLPQELYPPSQIV